MIDFVYRRCGALLIVFFSTNFSLAEGVDQLISQVGPSAVTIEVSGRDGKRYGIGTGFVIDSDGLIATNFHVINEGREFTIETADGKALQVISIEAFDRVGDLAIIRVEASYLANLKDARQLFQILIKFQQLLTIKGAATARSLLVFHNHSGGP